MLRARNGTTAGRFGAHILLWVTSVFLILPIVWTLSTSLKTREHVYAYPPRVIPMPVTLENFAKAFVTQPLVRYIANSAFVGASTAVIGGAAAVFCAFALSRLKFRGKGVVMGLIVFTMMMPGLTNVVPLYRAYAALRLLDTYAGLVLVYVPGILAFSVFVIKNFFDQVPPSLEDAASIDGCSPFRTIVSIFVPLSAPALFAVSIINFVNRWNEFLLALVFTSRQVMRTLPVGIYNFIGFSYTDYGALSAAAVTAIAVPVTLFLSMKGRFINALMEGALKE